MKTSGGSIPFKKTFCLLGMCVLGCFVTLGANAQDASPNAIPRSAAAAQAPMFSDAELDQMLAPIALYPDVLLTQTLIASTYPSEAIEAGNWLKANPNLRGKEAVEAASQTNWDDSIKSLAAFPEILVPMAEYPDWTAGLGNAFLSQQQQLMNRVQFLRQKAKEQGNLKTNEQVKVQTTGQAANQTIVIEPATTQIVYVPYYNPTVVYGTWWWPAYTPVYWNPWPYAGYATGYSTGFMWSGVGLWFSYTSYRPVYDWHYHRVYIVDRHSRRPGHTGNRCRDGNGITGPITGMMFPIVTRPTNRVRIHQSPGSMENLTRNRTGHRETGLKANPEASICREKMIGFLSIKINGPVLPGWALRTISIMEAVRVLQKESRPIFQEKTTLRPIITVLPVDMAILQAPDVRYPSCRHSAGTGGLCQQIACAT